MAKSFFAQILDLAGISLPDPNTQYNDPTKYRQTEAPENASTQSPSGLTRVEQYLQKKNPQPKMTRVEQYLAKKQAAIKPTAEKEAPSHVNDSQLTGVERYLARKQASDKTARPKPQQKASPDKPMTRVEKYLAQKKTAHSKPEPAPRVKKTEASAATTGVDKYLSRKKSAPAPAPKKELITTPQPEEKQIVKAAETKKPAAENEVKKAEKKSPETTQEVKNKPGTPAAKTSAVIDHAENADQCQAATQKGSRCRRKSNLEVLTKTINKQKYRYAVCHQHNNNDFVPFEEFAPKP